MKKHLLTATLLFFSLYFVPILKAQVAESDSSDVEIKEENPPWLRIGKKNFVTVFRGRIVRFKGKGLLLFHNKKKAFVFPKAASFFIEDKKLKPVSYAFKGQKVHISGERNSWEIKPCSQKEFDDFRHNQKVVLDKNKKHYSLNSQNGKEIIFYISYKDDGEMVFIHNVEKKEEETENKN